MSKGEAPPRAYPDLHDHIAALEKAGQLIRVDRPINKDTEMHPLVRWQFRGGIAEDQRKAFLFTHVIDSKGKRYDIPVIVGGLAANREIYRIGLGCDLDKIEATWARAIAAPIPPRVVGNAPCHEIVITGDALNQEGMGLDGIPVPISTPGWDNAPYTTLSQYITKDPDTGVQNLGNYRGQVKTRRRLGMNPSLELRPGIYQHWLKYKRLGQKMPAAVVLGAPPAVTFVSTQKISESLDEFDVAGGLVGSPINVVKAVTVDLMVPAEAEIVIEGYIDTEWLEPEAPFGESHGHVNLQEYNAFMDVTAITRRKDAVLTSIISQVTPSESSLIKRVSLEPLLLQGLQSLGMKFVKRVSLHEPLDQFAQGLHPAYRKRHPAPGGLARDVWAYRAAPRRRKICHRAGRGHRSHQYGRGVVGALLSLQSGAGYRDPQTPRSGPWAALPAQWRGGCLRAVRRDVEGALPARVAAQARIYGERKEDLGGTRPAAAETAGALVRRIAGRMGRTLRRDGGARGEKRLLGDRRHHRAAKA